MKNKNNQILISSSADGENDPRLNNQKPLERKKSIKDLFELLTRRLVSDHRLMSNLPEGVETAEKELAKKVVNEVIEKGTIKAILNNEESLNSFMSNTNVSLTDVSPRSDPESPRIDTKEKELIKS